MGFPSSASSLDEVVAQARGTLRNLRAYCQNISAQLAAEPKDATIIFQIVDNMTGMVASANNWKQVGGLDAFVAANIPGYLGSAVADLTAIASACQAVVDWVVANFPKDSTNTFILAVSLNADGSRAYRQFTSAQTSGLRTLLASVVAAID